ncbi:DUF4065 domain-containing protein [Acinetobacter sp. WCHAc010052]|nr:DUF4065 domain-containing protein [Acinetobacter sp. WCHAc010052]
MPCLSLRVVVILGQQLEGLIVVKTLCGMFSAFTYRRYSMAHTALQVADEFTRLGNQDGKYFTQMQLLKLVYIAHGWMLAVFNEPLIYDEVQAWKFGPVIPNLYQELKIYGSSLIMDPILQFPTQFNEREHQIIHFTYASYGDFSAYQLSDITHAPDTPWSETYGKGVGWAELIPNNVIQSHYQNLYHKYFS